MRKFLYITILVLVPLWSVAQQDLGCKTYLNNIEKLYRSGSYLSIVQNQDLLKQCKYSREERSIIYKYLIPSLINLGFDSLADVYSYEFLRLNPYYHFQPQSDPLPLQRVMFKFYSFPRFVVGYSGGLDRIAVEKVKVYSLLDSADYDVPYNSRMSVLSLGFVEMNFTRSFAVGASLGVMYYNYKRSYPIYENLIVDYIEKAAFYNVNGYLKYTMNFLKVKGFVPYVKAGAYWGYTPRFYSEIDLREVRHDSVNQENLRVERYEDLPLTSRRQFRYGLSGYFGILYNLQRVNIFAETGFSKELVLYVTESGRYIPILTDGFYYVSDDFYLNKLYFNVGFSFNIKYIVKKKYQQ